MNGQPKIMPKWIEQIFHACPDVECIREYPEGWVANAYHWPAPATGYQTNRDGTVEEFRYDKKRRYGHGPQWTARTFNGGCKKRATIENAVKHAQKREGKER